MNRSGPFFDGVSPQRVMPSSFFALSRFFLRVDNVIFRVHDVRIYHNFDTNEVIREVKGKEAAYSDVKKVCTHAILEI